MAKIIGIVQVKGGAGRSTIATNRIDSGMLQCTLILPSVLIKGNLMAARKPQKTVQKASKKTEVKSGLVPEGDVRLTANIRGDLHMKLKMKAVQEQSDSLKGY